MNRYCVTVTCEARRGIVAVISGFLAEKGCNISDSAQFDDGETNRFFMRTSFVAETGASLGELRQDFAPLAAQYGMDATFYDEAQKLNVVIMVSRFGHCLNDLLYRVRIGALPINIVAVISNHQDFEQLVVSHDIPYHYVPVTKETKAEAEARHLAIIKETGAELVVLARYMQVLSDTLCQQLSGRVINIHHSFLPSFKGAHPYHQAHARGVKLIGATAHYVTAELDEGPIIEQDIIRVSHNQSPDDYVALGRDVESQVLARAIHAHAHRRVFLSGRKTIVFPASPGSFASSLRG